MPFPVLFLRVGLIKSLYFSGITLAYGGFVNILLANFKSYYFDAFLTTTTYFFLTLSTYLTAFLHCNYFASYSCFPNTFMIDLNCAGFSSILTHESNFILQLICKPYVIFSFTISAGLGSIYFIDVNYFSPYAKC